ncbi:glycyl-radical enzyme activating protein [Clostridium zeae]|uniref:Glycyl-radical enzyme activating protein n=1 Tax=Clostridium zeae TaxID=2759022 RepID=A0ABQ1EBR3_9CLOT|nr:glycyl-radical enzyme activating protein [Clostridium zeae]GFZ32099.1 glycyl-radical enzyme activating protein [Clostridium zeae]
MNGLISNIQRFSIHDGPGIRTTVFFKGCNLNCFWCHNPECLRSKIELQFFFNKCIFCMKCIDICPNGVHSLENGERILNREKCTGCGQCIEVCPPKALNLSGELISIEELLKRIDRDSPFYLMGGGVTFSGGEPFIQKNYLKKMLFLCKQKGYHTAVESALNVSWKSIEEISCLVDLFIIDIKTIDRLVHKSAVGEVNDTILENIKKLSYMGNEIWIRIPIIPSINDKVEDIVSIAEFIKKLKNVTKVELIPFHKLAINKYDSLGRNYKASELAVPSTDLINILNDKLKAIIEC